MTTRTTARMALLARVLGVLLAVFAAFSGVSPRVALAYTPPPPNGAVTDTSGKLSAEDDRILEAHIAAYRARTTNELAVLMVGSLGGESVDDVAYGAFNTWGVGKKGADNGVLLVIAPTERKMRIETGKGVGDRLTDLESSHILRERVGPMLKQERFREAILAGLEGIETALDRDGVSAAPSPGTAGKKVAPPRPATTGETIKVVLVLGFIVLVIGGALVLVILALVRSTRRRSTSSWSSGSSYDSSSSSSYSSSSSDWGGSSSSGGSSDFGSSGGSDFGGGSSGGGGSSDSY